MRRLRWPWQSVPAAPPARPLIADDIVTQADQHRDAGRWADAARAYSAAIARDPTAHRLWVQLGNVGKENGDLAGAVAAYRSALALDAEFADTHVQLGHALKLQGLRPQAIAAYASALRIDHNCQPALHELIALGEGSAAEAETGAGQRGLAAALQAVEDLRSALARIEQALPDIASLTSCPVAHYELFRRHFQLPPPPGPGAGLRWAVLAIDSDDGDPVALVRALAGQTHAPVAITIATDRPDLAPALQQIGFGGVKCPVRCVTLSAPPDLPDCDWLVVVRTSVVPKPFALAWLDWAAGMGDARALQTDEERAGGQTPILKAAHDPEADIPLHTHGMLALRVDVVGVTLPTAWHSGDLMECLAAAGGVAHLARVLASRTTMLPPALPRPRPRLPSAARDARIAVIIPTRNGKLLQACLDALRATASNVALLDIVVLDNGSDDRATLEILSGLEASESATVLRDNAPFNWARLSNAGAAACEAPLLMFLNDDVELRIPGWDDVLRRQLARPEIGAVGARLLYPDGAVQHAGMVFGPDGRAEHEGVGVEGVPDDIAARWISRRRVAAVTGACLACRRHDFDAVGGFDAVHLPIWFNDVDFCLKLRRDGKLILFEPAIAALHHESRTLRGQPDDERRRAIWRESLATLGTRWGAALATDPSFNPYFSRHGRPFQAISEPSPGAVLEQLRLTSRANAWRLD